MSIVKTTVRAERKLRIIYICEKCKHEHIVTLNMPFQRVYHGSMLSVSENEADARQKFQVEIDELINGWIKNTREGNRKALDVGACSKCKYIQSWQIEREAWPKRYSYWYGVFLGIILIIISLFFLPEKGVPVFTIAAIIITPILSIWTHFDGKKEAAMIRNSIDQSFKKRTPSFEISKLKSLLQTL
jgi:hypothetical protein